MFDIHRFFSSLVETQSTKEKVELIKAQSGNLIVEKILAVAYDPFIKFGIGKKILDSMDQVTVELPDLTIESEEVWRLFYRLKNKTLTGNAAKSAIRDMLHKLSVEDQDLFLAILAKDLRCGINSKLILNAFPGLFVNPTIMKADTDRSKIVFPAILEPKLDGARVYVRNDDGVITVLSSSWKEINHGGIFDVGVRFIPDGYTLDGEIIGIDKDGKILDRKVSNGLVNSAIAGTATKEKLNPLCIVCFDIPTEGVPLHDRRAMLKAIFSETDAEEHERFRLIDSKIVHSWEEVEANFSEARARSEEGVMVKNINSPWEPKRSKHWMKMKALNDCDLVVVSWEYGTGKNEKCIGNLNCQSSDGIYTVSVGSGLTDDERVSLMEMIEIGKTIVTIEYNELISNEKGEKSFFLPRFKWIRHDRSDADSAKKIEDTSK